MIPTPPQTGVGAKVGSKVGNVVGDSVGGSVASTPSKQENTSVQIVGNGWQKRLVKLESLT